MLALMQASAKLAAAGRGVAGAWLCMVSGDWHTVAASGRLGLAQMQVSAKPAAANRGGRCVAVHRLVAGAIAASGRLGLAQVQVSAKPATADRVVKRVAVLGE